MIRRATVVLAAAGLLLSGCGVRTQAQPTTVQPPPGPFSALASAQPAAPSTDPSGPIRQPVYFVKGGKVAPVTRGSVVAPDVEDLVALLRAGPTQAEQDAGFTTTLSGAQLVIGVHTEGPTVVVDLAPADEGSARSDEALAYAQIVTTLCTRPDVSAVSFVRDGQPVPVPRGDGQLSTGPLTPADYADVIAGR